MVWFVIFVNILAWILWLALIYFMIWLIIDLVYLGMRARVTELLQDLDYVKTLRNGEKRLRFISLTAQKAINFLDYIKHRFWIYILVFGD